MWYGLVLHIAGAEEVEAAEEVDAAAEVEATKEVEAAEDIEAAAAEVDAAAPEFEVNVGVSQELAGILAQILSDSLKDPIYSSPSTSSGT